MDDGMLGELYSFARRLGADNDRAVRVVKTALARMRVTDCAVDLYGHVRDAFCDEIN